MTHVALERSALYTAASTGRVPVARRSDVAWDDSAKRTHCGTHLMPRPMVFLDNTNSHAREKICITCVTCPKKDLDRIAERCTRAMSFYRHLVSCVILRGLSLHALQKAPLRRSVRGCQTRAGTILLHSRARDQYPSKSITIEHEQKAAVPFAATVPVRANVKRVASTARGRHPRDGYLEAEARAQNLRPEPHTSIALALFDCHLARVQRRQSR